MLSCKTICVWILTIIILVNAGIVRESNLNDNKVNYRLPNHVKPMSYDIRLNPHLVPDNFTFDGEVLIHIEILNTTRILKLHTRQLTIDKKDISLRTESKSDVYDLTTSDYNNETEMLSLGFDKDLSIGYYILHLKFTGVLSEKRTGFYRNAYTNDAGDEM